MKTTFLKRLGEATLSAVEKADAAYVARQDSKPIRQADKLEAHADFRLQQSKLRISKKGRAKLKQEALTDLMLAERLRDR